MFVARAAAPGYVGFPMNLCHVVREWTDRVRVSADQVRVAGLGRPLRDAPIGHHKVTDRPHQVTDRPHKVTDRPHKVSDRPHQNCV